MRLLGLGFILTGWYLLFGVFFGVLSFMRTNAYKHRTGNSPWHIHPIVWGIASVFSAIFGTVLSLIACSTNLHLRSSRSPERHLAQPPQATSQLAPPACALTAWLPDPTGRHQFRYFDGSAWTEHVANSGVISVDQL